MGPLVKGGWVLQVSTVAIVLWLVEVDDTFLICSALVLRYASLCNDLSIDLTLWNV